MPFRFRSVSRLAFVHILVASVLLVACGDDPEAARLAAEVERLGEAKPTDVPGIEGFPIPSSAVEIEGFQKGRYQLPDVSYAAIHAWYDRELPVGKDWKNWRWCFGGGSGSGKLREYELKDSITSVHIRMFGGSGSTGPVLTFEQYNSRMQHDC